MENTWRQIQAEHPGIRIEVDINVRYADAGDTIPTQFDVVYTAGSEDSVEMEFINVP